MSRIYEIRSTVGKMTAKEIKVLLYGLGAIGSFYAFILSRNKTVVLDVVARSNHEAVKSKV